ncbi:unnamed protein product, partial [Polarella glacialis]
CAALPEEALSWDERECNLWFCTDGEFHPREALGEGWQPLPAAASRPGSVTVVALTTGSRRRFHELLWWNFECQRFPDKELVIVETFDEEPSSFLSQKAARHENVTHLCLLRAPGQDLSIGTKRNLGVHVARGELIAHFDDDDLYAPAYLETLTAKLLQSDLAKALKLSSWFAGDALDGSFALCDAARLGRRQHLSRREPPVKSGLYGFGFSLLYRRSVALQLAFADTNVGEDLDWCLRVMDVHGSQGIILVPDESGLCLHVQHGENLSCFSDCRFREVPREQIMGLQVSSSPGFQIYMQLAKEASQVAQEQEESESP